MFACLIPSPQTSSHSQNQIFLGDQNLFSLSIHTKNTADPVTIEMLSQKSAGESRMNDILDQMHN